MPADADRARDGWSAVGPECAGGGRGSLTGASSVPVAVLRRVEDEFVYEPRGTIPVKGKGEIEAWYLSAPRTS